MPVNRGTFAGFLKPDLYRVYVESGLERPLEYESYFNIKDMPWNPVDDRNVAGLGSLQSVGEGETFPLDEPLPGNSISYEAEIFALAVEITFPMWYDDQYGVIRDLVSELARSSRYKQEVEAWSVINNGFDTSFAGFDGTCLFSASHTLLGGGTAANRPSSDVGLSTLAIQNAIIRFETMVNERGLPRLFSPSKLLISGSNRFLAREVLGSAGKPFTADNEQNSLLQDDLSWQVIHYLTDSTQWVLSAPPGQHDLNFMWRNRPIFDTFDDPWSKNAVATVWQRHTKGYGTWRGVDSSRSS